VTFRNLRAKADDIFHQSREAMRVSLVLRVQSRFLRQQVILGQLAPQPSLPERPGAHIPQLLSSREIEVLQLIAAGKTTRAIAEELGISFKTVATHRAHIIQKLEAENTAAVIRTAYRLGLLKE